MQQSAITAAAARPPQVSHAAEQLVLATIREHAESLLRVARRHSLCADDAYDAYQRALEIFLRHADRLDPERAARWLYTVCKHEAMAVRSQRQKIVSGAELDLDALESRTTPSPEEQVISAERVARSAEALRRLKPQEVRALWLRAEGRSYQAICEETGWTYTKVNRCLAEGRASFLANYAGIESGDECRRLAPALSAMVDGEATAQQLVELRSHLRNCRACRAALRELHDVARPLGLVLPGLAFAGAPGGHGSLLDRVAGGVARLLDTVVHGVHERAAAVMIRGQAALDAATSGKAAAIAASAAAVAGGGAIVIDGTTAADHARRGVHTSHRPERVTARPATTEASTRWQAIRLLEPAARRRSQPPAQSEAPTTSHRRRPSTDAASEPLVDPVESGTSQRGPAPAPPAAATKSPVSPSTSTTHSSTAAGGEFGFESP